MFHELPAPVNIEFRDGERSVAPHVAKLIDIAGIDPLTMTYEEAVEAANKAVLKNRLNDIHDRFIYGHFNRPRY